VPQRPGHGPAPLELDRSITLHQLRVFRAVADHLSFSAAAQELSLSQPSVSYQVKELESALGLSLLDRLGKRGQLTEAGGLLYGYVRRMLNLLDETSLRVYLSDGGHIENLGVYELLKRGCQLIVAIDAECDPDLAFGSLVKMERYARIDLGIRIDLPWEQITDGHKSYGGLLDAGLAAVPGRNGPHGAAGRILYHDGSEGVLLYFKSSLTGDETDYVLDYGKRNPSFPHETTGDQFFSEEQFEAYRALGFHVVDSALAGTDPIAISDELRRRGVTPATLLDWIRQAVCQPAAP